MTAPLATELANILSAVVAQIRGLSDDEVRALAAGEAEFRIVPKKPARRASPPREPARESTKDSTRESARESAKDSTKDSAQDADLDLDEIRAGLRAVASEAEATAYLQGLRLTPASARALATELGLRLPARPTVTSISAEIVRVFVGGRLNALTVQRL